MDSPHIPGGLACQHKAGGVTSQPWLWEDPTTVSLSFGKKREDTSSTRTYVSRDGFLHGEPVLPSVAAATLSF